MSKQFNKCHILYFIEYMSSFILVIGVKLQELKILLGDCLTCEELSGGYSQEKRRRIERMMSRCFTWFPISGLGEPNIYHDSGGFYKNVGSIRKYSLVILDVS